VLLLVSHGKRDYSVVCKEHPIGNAFDVLLYRTGEALHNDRTLGTPLLMVGVRNLETRWEVQRAIILVSAPPVRLSCGRDAPVTLFRMKITSGLHFNQRIDQAHRRLP
jgi:hypothetical protein